MADEIENTGTDDEVVDQPVDEIPDDGVPLNPETATDNEPAAPAETPIDTGAITPAATTATPAATPRKRPVAQPAEPDLKEFDQIQTLGDALDIDLDAGGKLKEFAGTMTKLVKGLAKENFDLKQQVGAQGDVIGSVSFGKQHDADPANAKYPWAQAEKDLARIQNEVAADPQYADKSPDLQDWIALDRFNQHKTSKRAGTPAATTDTPAPTPTGLPPVRRVGSTRTIPRQTRQAPPVPAKARTVNDQLRDGILPGGKATERALADFGN